MCSAYNMYAVVVLLVCFSCVNGKLHIGAANLDSNNNDPQWRDFVNQKIDLLERQMAVKDEVINRLESIIRNQNVDMMQLKQQMTFSLEQLVLRKDNMQGNQVSAEEKRGSVDLNPNVNISPPARNTSRNPVQLSGGPLLDYPNGVLSDPDKHLSGDESEKHPPFFQGPNRLVENSRQKRVAGVPSSEPIAFHASLNSPINHGTLTTVVFNQELLDRGNGYSPSDGIYIVPESGTYVITWTMLCNLHCAFQTNLIVDGRKRGYSYTDSDEINDYHQTSQLVVLELSQGDRVFIQIGYVARGGNAKIMSGDSLARPTFSGWKIF